MVIVGDASELDGEGILAEHGQKNQVLQEIADSPVKTAVKLEFESLVVRNETGVEFEESGPFGHHDLGPIGYFFNQRQKTGFL